MSKILGRSLSKDERVHHIYGNKLNNSSSNLELWVISQPPGQRTVDAFIWAKQVISDQD